ncbi:MAG: response regulator transcription factor [Firmicutes bacterium]|nr:response regulator transcription factor [Bacillota bacterium]
MLEFIICDDDKIITEKVEKTIDDIMMKNKIIYKTISFYDYNDEFIKLINNKECIRIYILDIETPSRSGIDIARVIREKDMESIIIFMTGHDELGPAVLKKELWFLSFINKFENSDERLKKSILKALQILNIQTKLHFEERGVIYNISLNDILYITRDSIERKSIIKTEKNEYKTYKTLLELSSMLDERFVQTHRACIVNKERVAIINSMKKKILFDSGLTIDLLSDKYKKELKSKC